MSAMLLLHSLLDFLPSPALIVVLAVVYVLPSLNLLGETVWHVRCRPCHLPVTDIELVESARDRGFGHSD